MVTSEIREYCHEYTIILWVKKRASVNSSCAQHPPPPIWHFPGGGVLNFALPEGLAFANPEATTELLTSST